MIEWMFFVGVRFPSRARCCDVSATMCYVVFSFRCVEEDGEEDEMEIVFLPVFFRSLTSSLFLPILTIGERSYLCT